MITFKIKPHSESSIRDMVEVWSDGKFIAGIYVRGVDKISVISKYLADIPEPFHGKSEAVAEVRFDLSTLQN